MTDIAALFKMVSNDPRIVESARRVNTAIVIRDAWRERVDSVADTDTLHRYANALALLEAARREHAATVTEVTRELTEGRTP